MGWNAIDGENEVVCQALTLQDRCGYDSPAHVGSSFGDRERKRRQKVFSLEVRGAIDRLQLSRELRSRFLVERTKDQRLIPADILNSDDRCVRRLREQSNTLAL